MDNRRNHIDESSLDLGKYIGGIDDDHRDDRTINARNLHSQQFSMQIDRINMKLQSICSERLGDLTSISTRQIQKTIQLVQALINQIKKYMQLKNKMVIDRRQLQQTITQNQNIIQRLGKEKKNIQNQKENILHKFRNLQKTYKETVDKNQLQKQQLNKQIKSFQLRQKTFEAEFRKKQNQIKALQDGIKKFQDKVHYKNSFQIIQKFQIGPNIYDKFSTNAENQYGRLAKQAKQLSGRQVYQQNLYLKQCLISIYKQLNSVLQLKKQTLKNKKGYDGQYQHYFQLNSFKPERILSSLPYIQSSVKQLMQNVQKFKEAMKIGDQSENRFEQKKDHCINGIRKLITNYKQVVETQDQMLNKVLLKAKQFKTNQMDQLSNKFSNTQDIKTRSIIEQHHQFLQMKGKELQRQKQQMKKVIKKSQQIKKQMQLNQKKTQEQMGSIRQTIQILPIIINEEIEKVTH